MPPEQKLLYLYLFTSPSTNNLGVLSVTVRKIAFETGLDEDDVREFLEDLEFDGRIVKEDGDIWVCGFIRHQCSTSPKILTSLRALLPTVESAAIRRGHSETLPPTCSRPRHALPISIAYRPGNRNGKWKKRNLIGRRA